MGIIKIKIGSGTSINQIKSATLLVSTIYMQNQTEMV